MKKINILWIVMLLLFMPSALALVYDDFEDGVINTSLWSNTTSGAYPTIDEADGRLITYGFCTLAGTSTAKLTSIDLPEIDQINSLTTNWYAKAIKNWNTGSDWGKGWFNAFGATVGYIETPSFSVLYESNITVTLERNYSYPGQNIFDITWTGVCADCTPSNYNINATDNIIYIQAQGKCSSSNDAQGGSYLYFVNYTTKGFVVSAFDNYTSTMYDQTPIYNFTVSMSNGTDTITGTANSTYLDLGNLTGLWNISVWKDLPDQYANRTYLNHNVSEDLGVYLYSTHYHDEQNFSCYDCVNSTFIHSAYGSTSFWGSDQLLFEAYTNQNRAKIYGKFYFTEFINASSVGSDAFLYMWKYQHSCASGAYYSLYKLTNCDFVLPTLTWNDAPHGVCSESNQETKNNCETSINTWSNWSMSGYDNLQTGKFVIMYDQVQHPTNSESFRAWNWTTNTTQQPYLVFDYYSNFTIAVFDEVSQLPLENATITISKWDNASINRTDELGSNTSIVYPFDAGIYDIDVNVEGTIVSFENYDLSTQSNYLTVEVAPHYLNLSIYNWSSYPTLALMNQTVDITLTGAEIEYFENTSNGSLEGYFNAGDYTLKLESAGFETNYYFFNLDGLTDMSTYMFETGSCSDVDFTIQDIAGTVIEDAKLSFYKQINLTWVVVTEKYSDISGIATVCLDNEAYKLYVEKAGFDTWVGEFTPTQASYTISLAGVSGGTFSFQDIFGGISFYYSPTDLNQFGSTNFSLTVSTISNNVQAFSIFSNYDGVDYTTLVSGSLAGGQATIELPLSNAQRFFNVSLYIESVDNQTWNETIYFQSFNFTPSNYSLLVLAEEWIGTEDAFTVTFLTYLFVIIILALLFSAGAPLFAGYGVGVFLIGTLAFVGLIPVSMATVTCVLLVGLMVVSSEGWL